MTELRMRFPGGLKKVLTLSYDDGVEQDFRLIDIMKKNGLKGTFNLNSGLYKDPKTVYEPGRVHRRMTEAEATGLYTKSGMEVAVHGLTHPFLERLPADRCLMEIVRDRENLEKQFGVFVRGAAYPFSTYNDQVVEAMRLAGIIYARTGNITRGFDLPQDWLRLAPTTHHKDPGLMELAEEFALDKRESCGNPQMFYLCGHSYEFEQDDNWDVIERFAAYMGGRPDIWYATNLEICEYVENFNRLIFSLDGTRVYNPTCQELYMDTDGAVRRILPGETIEL